MPTLRQHFHPMAEPEALLIWYQARDQLTTRARDAGKAIHSINIILFQRYNHCCPAWYNNDNHFGSCS
jgi:hypothetical protein